MISKVHMCLEAHALKQGSNLLRSQWKWLKQECQLYKASYVHMYIWMYNWEKNQAKRTWVWYKTINIIEVELAGLLTYWNSLNFI